MLYLDAAVVLSLFVRDGNSAAVDTWVTGRRQPLAFSDWGLTECASALGIRVRRGEMAASLAGHSFDAIAAFARESCEMIACAPHHQTEAQRLLTRFDLPLRAGDALHVALSRHAEAALVTCDTQLATAARTLGAKVHNPLARTGR